MAKLEDIYRWDSLPNACIEHREPASLVSSTGKVNFTIIFLRFVPTMTPDEIIYIKTLWAAKDYGELDQSRFDNMRRFVCVNSDSDIDFESLPQSRRDEGLAVAYQKIKSISGLQRGAAYSGFETAIIAMARHARDPALRAFLTEFATILKNWHVSALGGHQ